jgi:hypothetical protein
MSTVIPHPNHTYQDSVGISALVPHSSQTHQDGVGISTLVPHSSQTKYQDSPHYPGEFD